MTVEYDGKKWTRQKNGYYECTTRLFHGPKWLHQYVYLKEVGELIPGCDIHHINKNKDDNRPENLMQLANADHQAMHIRNKYTLTNEEYIHLCGHLDKVRPDHVWPTKGTEKYEWHRRRLLDGMRDSEPIEYTCMRCGKRFMHVSFGLTKFCSNKCKSAWRRDHHLDDEVRICSICNNSFSVNKYKDTKTCSRHCANILRARTINGICKD